MKGGKRKEKKRKKKKGGGGERKKRRKKKGGGGGTKKKKKKMSSTRVKYFTLWSIVQYLTLLFHLVFHRILGVRKSSEGHLVYSLRQAVFKNCLDCPSSNYALQLNKTDHF